MSSCGTVSPIRASYDRRLSTASKGKTISKNSATLRVLRHGKRVHSLLTRAKLSISRRLLKWREGPGKQPPRGGGIVRRRHPSKKARTEPRSISRRGRRSHRGAKKPMRVGRRRVLKSISRSRRRNGPIIISSISVLSSPSARKPNRPSSIPFTPASRKLSQRLRR